MSRRVLSLLLGFAVVLSLAACGDGQTAGDAGGGGEPGAPPAADIGDPALGEELFRTGGASGTACNTCHTLDGTELVGPSLQGISERAADRVPGLTAAEYIHQSIVDPGAYINEGYENLMPDIYEDALAEQEINALVAFLLTQ